MEVQAAERFRDAHLTRLDDMVRHYVGECYSSQMAGAWSENHAYEFIRLTTGRVIFDNPRVTVKTDRPYVMADIAEALKFGLNRWCRKVQLRRLLKRLYVNQCFAYSVAQTVSEAQPNLDPRSDFTPHIPRCYELDADRFFFDSLCSHYEGARFAGHKWVRDRQDLFDEAEENPQAGWNVDAIMAVGDDAGIENLRREGKNSHNHSRKELVAYEIWVPEINVNDPSQGFNGTLYTIAAEGSGDKELMYLREPRPFWGPRTGPYTMFGVYPVPRDPYPLSPFAATWTQQRELNEIVNAINKGVHEYKRVVLFSAENPDLGRKLKQSKDCQPIAIKGFAKDQIEVIEQGGVTEQHIKMLEMALSRCDRNTGINDTRRGNVEGEATATEIAVADAGAETSIAFVKQEFTDSTVQLLDNVKWYMMRDDRVQIALGEEAAMQMGMLEPVYMGGPSPNDPPGMMEDEAELDIEPYSMERMNESLARAQYQEMMELVLAAAPIIPTAPFYDWEKLFKKGGDVMNDAAFAEFYNPQMAQQAQMITMQSQVAEQQAAMAGDQPNPDEENRANEESSAKVDAQRSDIGNKRMVAQATVRQKNAQAKAALRKPPKAGKSK